MAIRRETFVFTNSMSHADIEQAFASFLRDRGRAVEKHVAHRTPRKTIIVLTYEESRSGEHLPPQTTALR